MPRSVMSAYRRSKTRVQPLPQLNADIADAESLPEQRQGELEAANTQLEGMVPQLMALSKQMVGRSTVKAQTANPPSMAASGR
jgi:hypothetical protein